jgi:hypothetical protein
LWYAQGVKLLILYRPISDHATVVESFVRDFKQQHEAGQDLELVSVDTRAGDDMARLYDVTAYPAMLALSDDGVVLNMWMGQPLPLMNEVAGYLYAGR